MWIKKQLRRFSLYFRGVGLFFLIHKKLSAGFLVLAVFLLFFWRALPQPLFDTPLSAVLESKEGRLLGARIAADGQWRFPACDSVPEKFRQCIIYYEDRRFYSHPGVDVPAVARALILNVRNRRVVSGASTLSMQVIRMSCSKEGGRTFFKKIKEAFLAVRLECGYSKEEILSLYASNAPFGGNVVGLEAASYRFFGVPAAALSWGESALLAVLPNAPALIHLGKNREGLLRKRNALLDKLCREHVLSEEDCRLAKEEPLPEKPYPMPEVASHYLESLIRQNGSGRYFSSISYPLQARTVEVAQRYVNYFNSNGVNNIAVLVLDTRTGEPLAYVGNVVPDGPPVMRKQYSPAVDIVTAPRSSGSTLKPLLYAAMLQSGEILPTMLVKDIPFRYKNFNPHNYNKTFEGAVPAHSVIERSLNVPSVRMLDEYGTERFLQLLREEGFSTITQRADYYGLALILGGAEITLKDLAAAYCGMAEKLNGFLSGAGGGKEPGSALSPGSIWLTLEALSRVNRPEEEGDWTLYSSSRKIAWKTGTSWGNRDAWSIGVTPEYVVGVWVGNATGEGRPNLTGVGYAAPVMFDVFSLLPPTGWFAVPEMDLEKIIVCRKSGHPVTAACLHKNAPDIPDYGLCDTVWAPSAANRPEPCPYHKMIHTDSTGAYLVNTSCCPVNEMKTISWFLLPAAQEWYYMQNHLDYRKLPPLHPDMEGSGSGLSRQIDILYPQEGAVVIPAVALDGISKGAVFKAFHQNKEAILFWHIDGRFVGTTLYPSHEMIVVPSPGKHTLKLADDAGNTASVRFSGE